MKRIVFASFICLVAACSDSDSDSQPNTDPDASANPPGFSIASFSATGDGGGSLAIEFQWTFDDPDGLVQECRLDPGDGSGDQQVECGAGAATHQYQADGFYTAKLTATTATSAASATADVEVAPPAELPRWAQQLVGAAGPVYGRDVDVDSAGNAYLVGTVGVDAVIEGASASAGLEDFFVAKVDPAGNTLWVQQLGTSGYDQAWAVEVDSAGTVYVSGATTGDLVGEATGGRDAFVLALDGDGNQLWGRQLGGSDTSHGVAVHEGTGDVLIAGFTDGAIDGALGTSTGDGFVARYGAGGALLWVAQYDAADDSTSFNPRGLAVDAAGNAYATGWVTFGGAINDPAGQAVLVQVSGAGAVTRRQLLGAADAIDHGEAVAASGDTVFVGGATRGSYGGEYGNGWDSFVAAFDGAGNELWVDQHSGELDDFGYGLAVDGAGNLYAVAESYVAPGDDRAVVTSYRPDGTERWTGQVDGTRSSGRGVTVAASGAVLVAGHTGDDLDGESMAGGFVDAFVATAQP